MRRTTILLLIVIVLAGIYYFTSKKTEEKINTVNIEDREFVVDSEDDISIFTIKNPGYPLMHFARQEDGSWMLNNKYKADPLHREEYDWCLEEHEDQVSASQDND